MPAAELTPETPPEPLRRMCDALRHRGPDEDGYHWDAHVALGHRRLSIIDVAGGSQPMCNEDGTVWVTYNGEIYNFTELREQLSSKGHRFRTHSDTEVLVHLYEDEGERAPERLNGMFAFAVWDARNRSLLLARDRFGEKPLYYTRAIPGYHFCFASELKGLLAVPGFAPEVEPRGVADFLSLRYIPDPGTIFRDVYKLAPGHSLTATASGERLRRYWRPDFDENPCGSLEQGVEQLRGLFEDAVTRRMMSDVPLGAFLSGGVDSSSVVAMMSPHALGPLKTFSIGFTSRKFDERGYAQLVAKQFETEHHERVFSPDVHETLAALADQFDEPFADSSAIPTLGVARLAREQVTVALSGDGSDEIFGGYARYFREWTKDRVRHLLPEPARGLLCMAARLPQPEQLRKRVLSLGGNLADSYFTIMTAFRDDNLDAVLSPEMRTGLGGYSPRDSFRDRFRRVSHLPPLHQLQAVDFETYLPGDILTKVDRATMYHSLESRAPFLDHRIGELAFHLAPHLKVRGANGKYILKRLMRGSIPDQVITRPKMGFVAPLHDWFRTSLRPVFESAVLREPMEEYLSLDEVRRLWREPAESDKWWTLLMLALWHQRWRGANS